MCWEIQTLFSHLGTLLFLSPRTYKLMTMTERNVDRVMRIMLRQKYAPEIEKDSCLNKAEIE